MPELPDVTVYLEALATRIGGARLERIRLANPFVLRSVDPSPAEVAGRTVTGLRRLGKRIVIALEGELFVLVHLMIAGRLHWKPPGARPVHARIASAAQRAPFFAWQAAQAFGVPSGAERSGRGMRIEWSWRASIRMYVVVGMWQATHAAPGVPFA